MLSYVYSGEFMIDKFKEARTFLDNVGSKLQSKFEKEICRFESPNELVYKSENSENFPKVLFSLRNRFPGELCNRPASTNFKNEIYWTNHNGLFNNVYKEFAEAHKELVKFYGQIGIENLTTWSDWSEEERELFNLGKLNLLYWPKIY